MTKEKTDATDMAPPDLLRAAARLVEKALAKLDMTSTPCPHCENELFFNRDQAKVFEQLRELPLKLQNAADRLRQSVLANGQPRESSTGFKTAARYQHE